MTDKPFKYTLLLWVKVLLAISPVIALCNGFLAVGLTMLWSLSIILLVFLVHKKYIVFQPKEEDHEEDN